MSPAESAFNVATLLVLPNEILTLIIKELFARRNENRLAHSVTLLRPGDHAILLTCRRLWDLGIYHYHASSELFVEHHGLTALGPLGWAGNKTSAPTTTVHSWLDAEAILSAPGLFSNLKDLKWDMTTPGGTYSHWKQFLLRVRHHIPLEALQLDPVKVFTTRKENCGSCRRKCGDCQDFSHILKHCRLLRSQILRVEVKFPVFCFHVHCSAHPKIQHEILLDYVLKIADEETLEIGGTPRWLLEVFDDEFEDYRKKENRADCKCETQFTNSKHIWALEQVEG